MICLQPLARRIALALTLSLHAACGGGDTEAGEPNGYDRAGDHLGDAADSAKDAAREVGAAAKEAWDETKPRVKEAARKAGDATQDAWDATKEGARDVAERAKRGYDAAVSDPPVDDAVDPAAGEDAESVGASLYALEVQSLEGEAVPLTQYKGQVTLVVNVASKCGFTPQYEGLQALHAELAEQGFAVLGFPSNEFGGQEPGTPAEIRSFCTENYGVEFPMFAKGETRSGETQSPVYKLLGDATGELPSWNFGKYLVGRDGRPKAYFDSRTGPDSPELRDAILKALDE